MMVSYYSFLLRLWQAGGTEQSRWRVSLESPHTREVLGFDSLETLFDYLQQLTDEGDRPDAADASGGKLP